MDTAIAQKLIQLNQQFYQTFAAQFSATRQRIQPGVQDAIRQIKAGSQVLDLGCGNGKLWERMVEQGFRGGYTGLDFSASLLEEALRRAALVCTGQPVLDAPIFRQADLTGPGWSNDLQGHGFDFILAFAVLHHLPGQQTVRGLLAQASELLAPGGRLIFSVWQFLNSPRLRGRIQDWSLAGLSPDQVDPGDYLLDWRQGGHGLRYVHHYTLEELDHLASRCGFTCIGSHLSDGKGGDLSLYQTWILENVIV